MTFEKTLDLSIMFDDMFEKCNTEKELDDMRYDLECIIANSYEERLEEIGG